MIPSTASWRSLQPPTHPSATTVRAGPTWSVCSGMRVWLLKSYRGTDTTARISAPQVLCKKWKLNGVGVVEIDPFLAAMDRWLRSL